MNKESIDKAFDSIITALSNTNMDKVDKAELMLNIMHFLDNYEDNIKVLSKQRRNKWENQQKKT